LATSKKSVESKEVVEQTALVPEAPAGALAAVSPYGNLAGAGFQNVKPEDLKTPFIKQLQGMSPEITDGMEGAKLGMFYNTSTGELIPADKGFVAVPIEKVHHYVEWRPREAGGGFVGTHAINSEVVAKAIALNGGNKFGKLKVPSFNQEGQSTGFNDIIESHDVLLMILDETGTKHRDGDTAIFAFTSTKIKACRDWYTKMFTLKMPTDSNGNVQPRPPLFAFRSRFTGFKDPRTAKGVFFSTDIKAFAEGSWMDSLIIHPEATSILDWQKKLLGQAADLYGRFAKGEVKADYEKQTNAAVETTGEDVPF
jgi:hypothetical protein